LEAALGVLAGAAHPRLEGGGERHRRIPLGVWEIRSRG
jgi:hypothetical protein